MVVMCKINDAEWACLMFTIAKPDGSLQSVEDLREVNKAIIRKMYFLPKISNLSPKP